MENKKSTYWEFSAEGLKARISLLRKHSIRRDKRVESLHVNISPGNRKTGAIPSVSLLPVLDCVNCKICKIGCYDLRNDMIMKESRDSRSVNSAIYHSDPVRYFSEISEYIDRQYPRAFRWHIGGDILSEDYLAEMIDIAERFPDVKFLAFTKNFSVVNAWIATNGELPENLRIIFSGWIGLEMDNPYNLPTSHPVFADGSTSAPDGAKFCTGNCMECLKENRLCWNLNKGESVVFTAH